MFNKTSPPKGPQTLLSEPTTAPAQPPVSAPPVSGPPRTAARVATSMLGAGLVFEGTISGEVDLLIEGVMKGDVRVTRLTVGEHAAVEGHIRAHHVEVRGRVTGDIEAQAVNLTDTAYVEGDIAHGQLSIEIGAHFQGRCRPLRGEAPTATADVVVLDAARG